MPDTTSLRLRDLGAQLRPKPGSDLRLAALVLGTTFSAVGGGLAVTGLIGLLAGATNGARWEGESGNTKINLAIPGSILLQGGLGFGLASIRYWKRLARPDATRASLSFVVSRSELGVTLRRRF